MSRLADILMGMDDKRAPRPGLGGIPRLGETVEPRRQWRIVATLVIVVVMGILAVTVMLRPQATRRPSIRVAGPAPATAAAAPLPLAAPPVAPARDRAAELVRIGMEAARNGEMDEAAVAFRKAVDIDPTEAEAWNGLGVALVRLGDEPRGVEAFRRALRVVPGHAEAHRNLAIVLDRQGRGSEAARHYRAFLAKSPADSPERTTILARLEEMGARKAAE